MIMPELLRGARPDRPKYIFCRDIGPLSEICSGYLDYLDSKEYHEDNDYDSLIFEAAMEMFYGKDIWKWINEKM
jgi:hypothetical protein